MIYTSNYARKGGDKKAVAISRIPPRYYSGEWLVALAPSWDLLTLYKEKKVGEYEYTIRYLAELKATNVDPHMITQLEDDTVLLCYESPGEFCHRRILADWVERETGVVILEWKNEKELKADEQGRLVDDLFEL